MQNLAKENIQIMFKAIKSICSNTCRAVIIISFFLLPVAVSGQVGKRFPPEITSFIDSVTGSRILALTSREDVKDNKVYQTHASWTSDGRYILFSSDRAGDRQLFAYAEENGEIIQLTDERELKAGCLARKSNNYYLVRNQQVVELELNQILDEKKYKYGSYERVLGLIPEKYNAGGLSLDADEKILYMELSWLRNGDQSWGIGKIDLKSGQFEKVVEADFKIGHIQANPWVTSEILYCWETGGDSPQRMWLINGDGTNNRPLYVETPDEWVTHEIWRDKDHVQFNLAAHTAKLREKPTGIVAINVRTDEVKIYLNAEDSGYWHNTGTSDGKWGIADTFTGRLDLINLVTGGKTPLTQGHYLKGMGTHAHASVSPDNKRVLFNSSYLGGQNLMVVEIP